MTRCLELDASNIDPRFDQEMQAFFHITAPIIIPMLIGLVHFYKKEILIACYLMTEFVW